MFVFSSRRRHTRWNCDWSSDVCSSDLLGERSRNAARGRRGGGTFLECLLQLGDQNFGHRRLDDVVDHAELERTLEIGRASCRERVEIEGADVARTKRPLIEVGAEPGLA